MGQLVRPLSNEQLNAIRQQAQGKTQASNAPATAAEVAYETGIAGLGPVVTRIEKLEAQVKELQEKLATAAKNGAEIKALLEAAPAKSASAPVIIHNGAENANLGTGAKLHDRGHTQS